MASLEMKSKIKDEADIERLRGIVLRMCDQSGLVRDGLSIHHVQERGVDGVLREIGCGFQDWCIGYAVGLRDCGRTNLRVVSPAMVVWPGDKWGEEL